MVDDLKAWEERVSTGEVVGKDPRELTPESLRALGHQAMSPLRALRLRCLDCCGGAAQEVRYCTARTCASWPFRMGTSPWREKVKLSDSERERRRAQFAAVREKRRVGVLRETGDAE